MSDFSFASLIPAGSGSRSALQRQVELNRDREQARPRKGYRYHGANDLLAAHGTYFNGRELPDKWRDLIGPEQRCHVNASNAALATPELRYFTGFYMCGGTALHHSWCVDEDGGVVELTLRDTKSNEETGTPRNTWVFRAVDGGMGRIPWVPPVHWAYVGVEYDAAFAVKHGEIRGLPILDPVPMLYRASEELPMFKAQYTPLGFEITEPPEILAREHGGWGEDDEDDEDNPYDAEEPEYV